jgi:hypothetical protein
MGRTVLTATQLIQKIQAEHWGKFRRALRREDQVILDRLFDRAQYHAHAMAYASMPAPMEPILVAMLIELQRDLLRLQERAPIAVQSSPLAALPDCTVEDGSHS